MYPRLRAFVSFSKKLRVFAPLLALRRTKKGLKGWDFPNLLNLINI
jgi:hypothetical protein